RASAPAESSHSAAEVLPEARADLRAGDGARLVGARFPVHAAPLRQVPAQAPGEAPRRPRDDEARLREVRAAAAERDELRRGDALHAREARGAALAVPPPAQAEVGRAGPDAKCARRALRFADRRDDRLSGWGADLLAVPAGRRRTDRRADGATTDPLRV